MKSFGFIHEKKFDVNDGVTHNDILIVYSLSSVAEFSHHGLLEYISPHDLVISSCHAPIHFRAVGQVKWEFFYIIISGSHSKYFYNLIRSSNNILRVNPLSRVIELFTEIFNNKFDHSLLSNMRLSVLVQDLLYELYSITSSVSESKNKIPAKDSDVNKAIKYLKEHYKEELTIDTLCNQVLMSKFYFCKIFKLNTGMTIHQYLNEYRVQKSKELLSYSKLSVNNIANQVGFKNAVTYIRAFERVTKMTPSEYRKNF